jgi:adsorption protein B
VGAVQLPVIPIRTASSRWISGHYCDEFAEAHGKNLVVRETLGASLPLAGVACAIERRLMGHLAQRNGGRPFDAHSLTEDYELGIRIGAAGERTIMARIWDHEGRLVGTRACFPIRCKRQCAKKPVG